jgi:hypothetical protein
MTNARRIYWLQTILIAGVLVVLGNGLPTGVLAVVAWIGLAVVLIMLHYHLDVERKSVERRLDELELRQRHRG